MNLVLEQQVQHHFQQFDADVTMPDRPKSFAKKCQKSKSAIKIG